MKRLFWMLTVIAGLIWGSGDRETFKRDVKPVVAGGEQLDSIFHQGFKRYFLIHLPRNFKIDQKKALVFVLHGGGGTPEAIADLTGFSNLADMEGFIVVYPAAVNRRWNDGRRVRDFKSHRDEVDDVGFFVRLIDTITKRFSIDSSRIYAVGMSNGGMMCQRLGLELSDRLAAIASVAASLPENLVLNFTPKAPISVLMINGTGDQFVPYEGGWVGLLERRGRVVGVERTIGLWASFNGCSMQPIITVRSVEGDTVYQFVYSGGRDNSEVVLYKIIGTGHIWPGGKKRPPRFGKHSTVIDATKVIWDFFATHRRN